MGESEAVAIENRLAIATLASASAAEQGLSSEMLRLREETGMSDLFWLTDEQMERLRPFFPRSYGKPRVDDR